ncbi:LuxR family transcriptional regulator [Streptomyces sp. BG9H]|uniref:LuxR family transcriptional regulator n=1 Tax=Streptomyces anatolicus TaxID=2675858 RepID=A0ABS6YGX1_9ACTN|nr:LuxR family transcriptional regulator [Streptomyces anatolicus]MBW5420658.1 LuxR family transcriptional regulator [Streptomyces anatolicus]
MPESAPGDEFEQVLREVSSLIDSAVVPHRGRRYGNSLVHTVDEGDEAVDLARELIAGTVERIELVVASEFPCAGSLLKAMTELLDARHGEVAARLLATPAKLDWRLVQKYAAQRRWAEVRIARFPLLAAVLVDRREAVVIADSAVGRRASVIRAEGVVTPLLTLFDGMWRHSVSVTDQLNFKDTARTETARRILEQLRAGATDEASARDLDMSVRTYRRYVAEIMALLGATSRFQAGVRAAELGLLRTISR